MRSDSARRQHWASAQARPGEQRDAATNHVDWLIDNGEAYRALIDAIRDARESIWISQLAFDADCKAYASDGTERPGESLLHAILKVSGQRDVPVKILLNSTLLLDTKRPLLRFLSATGADAALVEVRGVSRFPQLLHAKMVVIDQRRAFLMGSPFVNGYWDNPDHAPVDNRRPRRELGGRPVHDVSLGLSGPTVRDLAEVFARLWNGASRPESDQELRVKPRDLRRGAMDRGLEVVTTAPNDAGKAADTGSRETLRALLDGIHRARSLIYIEHQYLSSRPVVEALQGALERQPALELIVLINQNPDVTAYRRWQNARLADAGLLAHPRVGLFGLWTTATVGSRSDINQVFVHSKVVIVDDEWAMVGSANLDGASLDSYGDDFTGRVARRVFRDVRNFDVSVVLTTGRPRPGQNRIRELRERLWAEHLGLRSSQRDEDGTGVRLALWRDLASRNVASLNGLTGSDSEFPDGSFILPYSTSATPRAQLSDAGVRKGALIDLRFDPGWLEVNFSPNWIRNMFL